MSRKIILFFFVVFLSTMSFTFSDEIFIIPDDSSWSSIDASAEEDEEEVKPHWEIVDKVWEKWWEVMDRYNKQAEIMDWDIWAQFATWIMTWDTIMNYIKYLVDFLSKLAFVVSALMIIYAWYLYAMQVFKNDWSTKWKSAIINSLLWLSLVIFSFAILSVLIKMFWT